MKPLSDSYLERQHEFYHQLITGNVFSEPKVHRPLNQDVARELEKHLKKIEVVICGNAKSVSLKVQEILSALSDIKEINEDMMNRICADLALAVFVGRDVVEDPNSKTFTLLPVIISFIDEFAKICIRLITKPYVPVTKNEPEKKDDFHKITGLQNSKKAKELNLDPVTISHTQYSSIDSKDAPGSAAISSDSEKAKVQEAKQNSGSGITVKMTPEEFELFKKFKAHYKEFESFQLFSAFQRQSSVGISSRSDGDAQTQPQSFTGLVP
jgi:hypothetical protein